MASIINATSSGITSTADSTGIMKVQSNGVTVTALAWVNFVGSTGAIGASYNVSSITRNGTGDYTVNFTNALSSASYAPLAMSRNGNIAGLNQGTLTTTSFRYSTSNTAGTAVDSSDNGVAVFGNS
jgi:hypothetical protein